MIKSHIYREGNEIADTLANISLSFFDFTWWDSPLSEIKKSLLDDTWGIPKHRFS